MFLQLCPLEPECWLGTPTWLWHPLLQVRLQKWGAGTQSCAEIWDLGLIRLWFSFSISFYCKYLLNWLVPGNLGLEFHLQIMMHKTLVATSSLSGLSAVAETLNKCFLLKWNCGSRWVLGSRVQNFPMGGLSGAGRRETGPRGLNSRRYNKTF